MISLGNDAKAVHHMASASAKRRTVGSATKGSLLNRLLEQNQRELCAESKTCAPLAVCWSDAYHQNRLNRSLASSPSEEKLSHPSSCDTVEQRRVEEDKTPSHRVPQGAKLRPSASKHASDSFGATPGSVRITTSKAHVTRSRLLKTSHDAYPLDRSFTASIRLNARRATEESTVVQEIPA